MTQNSLLQIILYLLFIVVLIKPLGLYMAAVYEGKACFLDKIVKPLEKGIYRICCIQFQQEMNWKEYAITMLLFNLLGIILLYLLQRFQVFLPLNPENFPSLSADLSFNTANSFVTNTNWQAYSGENTLSYFTQMIGLTVQNFLSAATGMSILAAFIRGINRRESSTLGNFWVDTIRGILYILLPLSIILASILVSQGVIQNFKKYQTVDLVQPIHYQESNSNISQSLTSQRIPMGPVASQVAIKQLGTNGGGYFNANSAHPFENPNAISNLFEMLAILLIPAALCYTFGAMIKDTKQGWAILITMFILFITTPFIVTVIESRGDPNLINPEAVSTSSSNQGLTHYSNMEGKEQRFGILSSSLWATLTTATGNGSVNAMLDSFLPLSGLIPLWLINLGEVVFGGVGTGLYQMLLFIIITVFVSGLMVGRTPEYLGKKIESFEMKMASFAILIMPVVVLVCTSIGVSTDMGKSSILNPGTHGLTEILYAFSSMANNNGSAFAGLNANTPFYNIVGGLAMLIGRYWLAIPVLAIAGSLVKKKVIPTSSGTLPSHTPLFIVLLVSIVLIIGALTFFPVFALSAIVEHLMMFKE